MSGTDADPGPRQQRIIDVLCEHFSALMAADPAAFRAKFRKMAGDPFAFYRGTASLFYADLADVEDPWADSKTSRIWIHGDLHAANFGTYLDGEGVLVFDVNDFDEAYLGSFTWDLRRFAASVALLGWTKALPDTAITTLIEIYLRAYLSQVRYFVDSDRDHEWALRLDTATGPVRQVLLEAQMSSRLHLLERLSVVDGHERRFRKGPGVRVLDGDERTTVEQAFDRYVDTVPQSKRFAPKSYRIKDIVGRSGFGIGSAGLPAYNVLVEGPTQALENDVVLSVKQGVRAAPALLVDDERVGDYFRHNGHRAALSQRALQAHADPWLGWTEIRGEGYLVRELSPYERDLDWADLVDAQEMEPLLDQLGRATAKVHCVSDEDSDQTLVRFQTEDAIVAALDGADERFVADITAFGLRYGDQARADHAVFVDAFRNDRIRGVSAQ